MSNKQNDRIAEYADKAIEYVESSVKLQGYSEEAKSVIVDSMVKASAVNFKKYADLGLIDKD